MRASTSGLYGEIIAEGYLRYKGYDILKTRYRTNKGEIDIIAYDKNQDTLVFAEVKTRRTFASGYAAEAVTAQKQLALAKCAMRYIQENHLENSICRFDVIEVTGRDFYDVNHIENAFYVEI